MTPKTVDNPAEIKNKSIPQLRPFKVLKKNVSNLMPLF